MENLQLTVNAYIDFCRRKLMRMNTEIGKATFFLSRLSRKYLYFVFLNGTKILLQAGITLMFFSGVLDFSLWYTFLSLFLFCRGSSSHIRRCVWYTCVVRGVTCNAIYHIYICLCYVYRSELKLRSVKTAIYGASLLCVAFCESCVGQKKPRDVARFTGAG